MNRSGFKLDLKTGPEFTSARNQHFPVAKNRFDRNFKLKHSKMGGGTCRAILQVSKEQVSLLLMAFWIMKRIFCLFD